jgi:hypothetical protein
MVYKSTDRTELKISQNYHITERNWHKSINIRNNRTGEAAQI